MLPKNDMSIKNILEKYKTKKAVTLETENKKISIREIENNVYEITKKDLMYVNGKIQEKTEIRKMTYYEYCQLMILASSMNYKIRENV